MLTRNKPILIIEGDPESKSIIKCALETVGVKSPFVHSNNSEDALIYLRDPKNIKPWLILFGLQSQGSDSLHNLKVIKTDELLKNIPVVIIADHHEEQKIVQGFELGAAGYIVKPNDSAKITNAIKTIMDYWNLSELPPAER